MTTSRPAVPAPATPFRSPPINGLLAAILRSRVHRLASGSSLLVRYRGRHTGIDRELPVQYATAGQRYVVLVGQPEAKRWWRNFVAPWPVTVVVRGRPIAATGRVVWGETDDGTDLATAFFARYPGSARRHGLPVRKGTTPDREDVRRAAAGLLLFEVVPARSPASR